MEALKQKPPKQHQETKYIIKDVFKEPDQKKRDEKILEIIKKHIKNH